MAPWSLWPQSTSQQQQQQQDQPTPSLPPKPSNPPSTQASTIPLSRPLEGKTKDAHYKSMPSSAELWQIATRSLQTGMVTGGLGLLVGAGSGIVRSAPPTLFAIFAGFQWLTLGSSYMASRDLLCHAWGGEENMSSSELVKASGVAGGVSGMIGGMIRGPKNILPGILFFGTLGAGSSYVSQLTRSTESKPKTSWLDSKWSPMQRLSDKDYMEKIEEKILRLDAEIAIIDENIASLKGSSRSPPAPTESTTK
ncbi:hypothetical protein O1611_g7077 [Lasiodiplodia mahajangana]|uniref:Uncharacterized protein n=1 Tax=Lasiodiplodia mahajangana TaxID=1108764 RepID=A0ACC2JGC7_9PEZI|nr:hypothetical protein O1611_g7077 [Lasiodiplodia mahajangana]